jgi:hypothetical protein
LDEYVVDQFNAQEKALGWNVVVSSSAVPSIPQSVKVQILCIYKD